MATVLVIEKDLNMRLLLSLELSDVLHRAIVVADLGQAEDALRFDLPDVVILGLGPHVADEFQTVCRLKSQYPDLPVILYTSGIDLSRTPVARMVDALEVKRSDPEPLMRTLARLIQQRAHMPIGS